ncbi:transposase [Xanthomonas sp. GW]
MTDIRKIDSRQQQIIGSLEQAEAGLAVKKVCRQGGFSEPTFYKWRASEPTTARNSPAGPSWPGCRRGASSTS